MSLGKTSQTPMAQYPQRVGEPDCRDFLRTGRCKYGESCKYHHPPNVQSGGGIRAPLDPSEPPFPIRPSEPPCQYYLKHGTCKFGQTCKFHHPPHIIASAGATSSSGLTRTVFMNVGGMHLAPKPSAQGGVQHIMLNASGTEGEIEHQGPVLQLLPQRPNEPDCIYFLRNGRCKYGATCKYNHPMPSTSRQNQQQQQHHQVQHHQHHRPIQVQFQQPQSRSGRGRSVSTGSISEVGSVATLQLVPSHTAVAGSYVPRQDGQQFGGSGGATHILVAERPIAVMTMNQNPPLPLSHHHTRGVNINDGPSQFYQQSSGMVDSSSLSSKPQEHSSVMSSPVMASTSSVASSYDTAASSMELLAGSTHVKQQQQEQVQAEATALPWHRSQSFQQLSSGNEINFSRAGSELSSKPRPRVSSLPPQPPTLGDSALDRDCIDLQEDESYHPSRSSSSIKRIVESPLIYSHPETNYEGSTGGEWANHAAQTVSPITRREKQVWENNRAQYGAGAGRLNVSSKKEEFSQSPKDMPRERFRDGLPPPKVSQANMAIKRKQRRHQQRGNTGNVDDHGLSMMTSALLNMLDTPDDDSSGEFNAEISSPTIAAGNLPSSSERTHSSSAPSTPLQSHLSGADIVPHSTFSALPPAETSSIQRSSNLFQREDGGSNFIASSNHHPLPSHEDSNDGIFLGLSPGNPADIVASPGTRPTTQNEVDQGIQWSPTWQRANSSTGQNQLDRNAQSVSVLNQSGASQATHTSQNVGLFLS